MITRKSLPLLFAIALLSAVGAYAQHAGEDYPIVSHDAAWCWFSDPRAVYHAGVPEQIYFGYIDSQGNVVIGARNLVTQEVDTFVLHERLQVDDHNVPSILMLPDDHILVFYTEHNGRSFMRKSRRPGDICAWSEERVIPFGGDRITYEICKAGGWMPQVASDEAVREPHYSGGMVIDHSDVSNVYLSREVDGRFELEHWKKEGLGWKVIPLTAQSSTQNVRPYAVKMPAGRPPVVLWMTGHYNHYTKFDTMLRIYTENQE